MKMSWKNWRKNELIFVKFGEESGWKWKEKKREDEFDFEWRIKWRLNENEKWNKKWKKILWILIKNGK